VVTRFRQKQGRKAGRAWERADDARAAVAVANHSRRSPSALSSATEGRQGDGVMLSMQCSPSKN